MKIDLLQYIICFIFPLWQLERPSPKLGLDFIRFFLQEKFVSNKIYILILLFGAQRFVHNIIDQYLLLNSYSLVLYISF